MEKHILTFRLPMIERLDLVQAIVAMGYNRTGNKFEVNFNGSKGYLSNITIGAEGIQPERNNIIWVERLRTKGGQLRAVDVEVYHSEEFGVRVAMPSVPDCEGNQVPRKKAVAAGSVDEGYDDDLPF